jgi:hypothetical protein
MSAAARMVWRVLAWVIAPSPAAKWSTTRSRTLDRLVTRSEAGR